MTAKRDLMEADPNAITAKKLHLESTIVQSFSQAWRSFRIKTALDRPGCGLTTRRFCFSQHGQRARSVMFSEWSLIQMVGAKDIARSLIGNKGIINILKMSNFVLCWTHSGIVHDQPSFLQKTSSFPTCKTTWGIRM